MSEEARGPAWSPAITRGRIRDAEARLRTIIRALTALGREDDARRLRAMCEVLGALHSEMKHDAYSHGGRVGCRSRRRRMERAAIVDAAVLRMERAVEAVLG